MGACGKKISQTREEYRQAKRQRTYLTHSNLMGDLDAHIEKTEKVRAHFI